MEFAPSSALIKKMVLKNYNGSKSIDITGIQGQLNIYESLASPVMVGTTLVTDALELLAEFPIIGEETLEIDFTGAADEKPFRQTFRTFRISNLVRHDDKAQSYIIHFCSPELFNNVQKRVVNGYSDKISVIAQQIFDDYISASKKKLKVEETRNSRDIAMPSISPFRALKMLKHYARTINDHSSNYMFFETQDSFHFRTVDSLIKGPVKETYYYTPTDYQLDFDGVSIKSYEVETFRDTIEFIRSGAAGVKLVTHDPVSKSVIETEYDYQKQFRESARMEKNAAFPSETKLSSERVVLMPSNSFQESYDEYHLQEIASLAQLDNTVMTLTIHGDQRRQVGDVIEFVLPNATDLDSATNKNHNFLSGKYLVTKVRHMIDGETFDTILQVVKNSMKKKIETKDDCSATF